MSIIENLDIDKPISIQENTHLNDRFGDARSDGTIRINTAKGDVVDTVIHELLHVEDFNKSEQRVATQSRKIEKKMSLAEAGMMLLEASQSQKPIPQRDMVHTQAGNIISNTN